MGLSLTALIISLLVAVFAGWLAYELLRQNGRLLLRLEAVERDLEELLRAELAGDENEQASQKRFRGGRSLAHSRLKRNGLARGTPAPPFALPRVDGGELSLSDLRGRPVLLVFSDPQCGPCQDLAPELERLHRKSVDVKIVMISRGDPALNRAKVRKHGLTFPVVLQRHWEISRLYAMFATPAGYLVDGNGIIASGVAVGVDAILRLPPGIADVVAAAGAWGGRARRFVRVAGDLKSVAEWGDTSSGP